MTWVHFKVHRSQKSYVPYQIDLFAAHRLWGFFQFFRFYIFSPTTCNYALLCLFLTKRPSSPYCLRVLYQEQDRIIYQVSSTQCHYNTNWILTKYYRQYNLRAIVDYVSAYFVLRSLGFLGQLTLASHDSWLRNRRFVCSFGTLNYRWHSQYHYKFNK